MTWTPKWHHTTQIHANGSGQDACYQASLARYLLEAYPKYGTTGEWVLVGQVLNRFSTPTVWTLINRISVLSRGTPDTPDNGPTSLDQAAACMHVYGLPVNYSTDFDAAYASPFALCLVDGTLLEPAQYPAGWFGSLGGQANHFILWLPSPDSGPLVDDPLAYNNGQQDASYSLESLKSAFFGAYLLPSTDTIVTVAGALKQKPTHSCPAALGPKRQPVSLVVGQVVLPTGTALHTDDDWVEIRLPNSPIHGWYPAKSVG